MSRRIAPLVLKPQIAAKKAPANTLSAEQTRALLSGIGTGTPVDIRDRALIALLIYTFTRVGVAVQMRLPDVYTHERQTWVRLQKKHGKPVEMPCHHNLGAWLKEYIDGAHLSLEPQGWLFRTSLGRSRMLSERPMSQSDVYRMIQRRAQNVGIQTKIGSDSLRATGLTEYLRSGGKLEIAQQMAGHKSIHTTAHYNRNYDRLTLAEIERIRI